MRDPRTPRRCRWLLRLAIVYLLSPIDLVPDWIPLLGQLDDVLIVPLLVWLAMLGVPAAVRDEHHQRLGIAPDHQA